jgi:4-diphosphocytidyl-2-C-methyl-D-erythritol kinase
MIFRSHAKINLGLRILGKRSDGYHDLETIFKLVDLHDRITIRPNSADHFRLTCSNPNLPADETNIATQAVRKIEQHIGRSTGLDILIEKVIPMGAGLGGGSSNAAAVLVGSSQVLNLGLPPETLLDMGAQLGSDVPFFVGCYLGRGTTAVGRGRGEILDFFDWPLTEKTVLVYPRIHVSTAWAYANFSKYLREENGVKKSSFSLTNTPESIKFSALLDKPLFFGNDFEPLVLANHDEIRQIRELLAAEKPVLSHMSGSGSTVFALFEHDRNVDSLVDRFSGSDVFLTDFVPSGSAFSEG